MMLTPAVEPQQGVAAKIAPSASLLKLLQSSSKMNAVSGVAFGLIPAFKV